MSLDPRGPFSFAWFSIEDRIESKARVRYDGVDRGVFPPDEVSGQNLLALVS
jgi:hypothetical protein